MKYHFEKPTIPRKSLEEQIRAAFEKLKEQHAWADTVPLAKEQDAFDDLAEAEKLERKRP